MKRTLTFLFLLLVFIAVSTPISAESHYVCAAVFPCDKDGNLLEKFADTSSPCFDYYLGQCLVQKTTTLNQSLKFCEFEKTQLISANSVSDDLTKARRKIRKLRKKIKQLKNK